MSERIQGTVKWFNPEKAYGFIESTQGDVFVHLNQVETGRKWLIEGQEVSLTVRPGQKGPEAVDVRVTRDVAPTDRIRAFEQRFNQPQRRRDERPRRQSAPFTGALPEGEVRGTIQRIDPSRRFLFVNIPHYGFDVYVNNALFAHLGPHLVEGAAVSVRIQQSERGLRATLFMLAKEA